MRWICAIWMVASPALAQPAVPAAAAGEDPDDVAARVRYERAIRAEYDGRKDDAVKEAQACLAAKPVGRFADAARALIARIESSPRVATSSTAGPRTALVIEGTFAGAYLSTLAAVAANAGAQGGTAIVMAGTGAALAASIMATSGKRVPESMPTMLGNGLTYGTYASLLILGLSDGFGGSGNGAVGAVLLGASLGSAAGLLSSLYVPGSDAAAISTGMIWGGALPLLTVAAINPHGSSKTALAILLGGSTAGMVAGPLLNHALLYSAGRWSLVTVGGLVGGLMGAGVGVLASAWNGDARGGLALTAVGSAAGLFLMAKFTDNFDSDRPSSALLHLEGNRLSAGSALTALSPARDGLHLNLFDARF